jgi:DNA uptake protein ComE-like DNA-binding protein
MSNRLPSFSRRRGFATLMVFLVIIFGAMVVSMVQSASYAQAAAGREAMARVRAHWAARAGVESALARLEAVREDDDDSDAYRMLNEMAAVADGEMDGASWSVRSTDDGREVAGPADAASRININLATAEQLNTVEPFMMPDVIDAIQDWRDGDDDALPQGAETGYYGGLMYAAGPRNGSFRTIAELELVAGVQADDVRGEDWNLNGLLDPNEDDGDTSFPPDNADGRLDRGWSGIFSTMSVEDSRGRSGEPKLDLTVAEEGEIQQRFRVSAEQAKAIRDYMQSGQTGGIPDFIRNNLSDLARVAVQRRGGTRQEQQQAARTQNLSREQLGLLIDEGTTIPAEVLRFVPSRLNVNTANVKTLEYLPEIEPEVADSIIAERSSKPQGFGSVAELLDVPGMTRQSLSIVAQLLCTRSNVYIVTCKGVDERSGLEVEMIATLDATTLPAVIREVRVR